MRIFHILHSEGVMTTTMGLFIVSVIAIFGAEMMIVVLCAKMLSVVPKWYGFLLFTHSSFGDLILMCAWIYLSSNKDQCWEDMKKGARVGKNVNLVICVSIVCSGVSAAFFYLGMKIWKGQGHLFARRSIDTVREHLLVSAYDDDDPSSSNEPPSSGVARIAVALHNCDGDNEDELSFQKGDTLELHEREGDWWVASLNGKRGLVPHNYIDEVSEEL